MKPIRQLAFVINEEKDGAPALGRELTQMAQNAGIKFRQTTRFPLPRNFLRGCDACCVIGGDGTLLGVARESAERQVPIIGVNRGSLGFLTTFSADEARAHFRQLLGGGFRIDRRAMLDCSTGPGTHDLALNDVLIKDEVNSRLIRLEVFADDELGCGVAKRCAFADGNIIFDDGGLGFVLNDDEVARMRHERPITRNRDE